MGVLKGVFTFFDVEHIFNPPVPGFTSWNLDFFGAPLRSPDPKIGAPNRTCAVWGNFLAYFLPSAALGMS